ncbi:trophoblast glycoprotein-like [Antedon mediterranea]|uniref:trophoblast glycoprotein-like n=1 Tax=Antedon mediterranea TaxID=105859 RepID=UPI003AF752E5
MLLLLLFAIPVVSGLNCTTLASLCDCTDLQNNLLKLVCNGKGIPDKESLPDNTAELHISGNTIENLTAHFLNKEMLQLTVLNLTNNEIKDVNESAFIHADFKALEVLILDNNKLVLNGNRLIKGLNKLKTLSMRNAFYNGTFASLVGTALRKSHTASLENIILDNNDFSGGLLPTTFNFSLTGKGSKPNIKSISLRNTSLEILFPGTFNKTHLPGLINLSLSDNNLQNVEKDVVNDFKQFPNTTIDFLGNPFTCNCRLYNFTTWINESSFVSNRENYTCSDESPKRNSGRKLLELDPINDLRDLCYDIEPENPNETLYASYIALSVVFGIVAILAMVILFLRRGEIKGYFMRMFNVAHETLSDKGGYTDMDNPYIPETPAVDV